jgi:hypothetical protein
MQRPDMQRPDTQRAVTPGADMLVVVMARDTAATTAAVDQCMTVVMVTTAPALAAKGTVFPLSAV